MDKPHSAALRRGRFSEPGRLYLITTVTLKRAPLFMEMAAARQLVRVLIKTERLGFAETWCYALMPDHLHWMMLLGRGAPLSQVIASVKQQVSLALGRPVWQTGFHDHAVRGDEDARALARYVINNPVRAGLVERVGEYPHWDAIWLRGGPSPP